MRKILLAFICLLAFCTPAYAQEGLGNFTVAPPKIENVQINPGQTISGTLQLFTQEKGQKFKAEVGAVSQDRNGSYIFTNPKKDSRDASSWLTLNQEQIDSGTNTVAPVTWTLKVPKAAEPGDHLAVIYITQLGKKNTQGGGAQINARVAIRMEITVSGEIRFKPVISQINVPRLSSEKNVPVSVTIRNEGNIRVDLNNADAVFEIKQGKKTPARFRLDGVLFPGSERVYRYTWEDAPVWGAPVAKVTLDFKDKERGKVDRSVHFYLAPYKILFAALAALVGLGLIITALRNRDKEEELAPEQEEPESPAQES